jgi:hypothetical protein
MLLQVHDASLFEAAYFVRKFQVIQKKMVWLISVKCSFLITQVVFEISSEQIFIYLKIGPGQVMNLRGAQIGGYAWEVLYIIKSECYSVQNMSVGLVLARIECLDLDLSFCGAQSRPACLRPPAPMNGLYCVERMRVPSACSPSALRMCDHNYHGGLSSQQPKRIQ